MVFYIIIISHASTFKMLQEDDGQFRRCIGHITKCQSDPNPIITIQATFPMYSGFRGVLKTMESHL